jgi:HSP20 family protein
VALARGDFEKEVAMATMQRNNGNQPQQQQPQRPMERASQEPQPLVRGGVLRSPFGVMRRFMDEMDRMFSDFGSLRPAFEREVAWSPQIELLEKDGKLVLRADLPGLKPDDVRVEVDRGVLTISGERKQEKKEEREGMYHSERFYGTFQRRIALPDDVDPDKIDARFENGVLEVVVPAPARQAGAKSIAVKSGANR